MSDQFVNDPGKMRKIALVRSLLDGSGAGKADLPKVTAPRCALKTAGAACCGGKGYVVTAVKQRVHG